VTSDDQGAMSRYRRLSRVSGFADRQLECWLEPLNGPIGRRVWGRRHGRHERRRPVRSAPVRLAHAVAGVTSWTCALIASVQGSCTNLGECVPNEERPTWRASSEGEPRHLVSSDRRHVSIGSNRVAKQSPAPVRVLELGPWPEAERCGHRSFVPKPLTNR